MRPDILKTQRLYLPLPVSQLHELMVAYCQTEFDRRGECAPTFIVQVPGWLVWIRTPWEDNGDKFASTEMISSLLKELHGISYAFAAEVFVSVYDAAEVREGNYEPPSRRKQRDDVLMIMSFQRDRKGPLFTRFLVNVRPPGKYNFLGPRVDEPEADYMSGDLMNLFLTLEERRAYVDQVMDSKP
jgi:hypothetical protein